MRINKSLSALYRCLPVLCLVSPYAIIAAPQSEGPDVAVTVTQVKQNPPTYEYTVEDLGDAPIISFIVGDDKTPIHPSNIPTSIRAPEGWSGDTNFANEADAMGINWECKDQAKAIPPHGSLRGFTVTMQPGRGRDVLDEEGRKVILLDMEAAPFQVLFKGGRTQHGHVRLKRPGKEKVAT